MQRILQANDSFHAANADYLHLLKRLAEVVVGQSGFQDWITAKGVTARCESRRAQRCDSAEKDRRTRPG
jgi:hypothetical protein